MESKGVTESISEGDSQSVTSGTSAALSSEWEQDKTCYVCGAKLSKSALGNKRFGCKFCNHGVCAKCSPNREQHPVTARTERICNICYRKKDGQETIKQLEDVLVKANNEILRLEMELKSEVKRRQEGEVQRVRKEKEFEELRAQVSGLTRELASKSDNKGLATELKTALAEVTVLKQASERLQGKIMLLEQANTALTLEVSEKNSQLNSTLKKLREAQEPLSHITELEAKLKSALENKAKTSQLLQEATALNERWEHTVRDLEGQRQESKTKIDAKEAEIQEIKHAESVKIKDFQDRISRLDAEKQELTQIQVNLKQELASNVSSQSQELSLLRLQLSATQRSLSESASRLQESESQRVKMEKDQGAEQRMVANKMETLQKTIQDFTALVEDQRLSSEEKEETIESLSSRLRDAEKRGKDAETRLETAVKTAAETESAQIRELRNELTSAERVLAELRNQLKHKEEEISGLQSELKSVLELSTALKYEKVTLQETIKSLQSEVLSSTNSIEDWRSRYSKSQQDLAVLTDKLSVSSKALETAEKQANLKQEKRANEEKVFRQQLRDQMEELNAFKRESGVHIQSLLSEKQLREALTQDMKKATDSLEAVTAEKVQKEVELRGCQERLRTLEEMHGILSQTHAETVSRLKQEMDSALRQISSLQEEKIRLTAELTQAQMNNERGKERLRETEEDRLKALKDLEEAHEAMNRGENEQIRTLAAENKGLHTSLREETEKRHLLESTLQTHVQQSQNALSASEKAVRSLSQAQSDLDVMRGKCLEKEEEVVRLTQDLVNSQEHALTLSLQLTDMRKTLELKEAEYSATLRKLTDSELAETADLEERMESYRMDSARDKADLQKTKSEYEQKEREFESRIQDLDRKLSTSTSLLSTLQQEQQKEWADFEKTKRSAFELIETLNTQIKEGTVLFKATEAERDQLRRQLDHYAKQNEELTENLSQERVLSVKKDKEIKRTKGTKPALIEVPKEPKVTPETPESVSLKLERMRRSQEAVVDRISSVRGVTKTMADRELEAIADPGSKRKNSDPGARDACKCLVF